MAEIHLAGYCDRFSARPGERLDIMVTAEGTDEVEVQLVRLIHGDENPEGPGFVEREVDAPVNGSHAVARQHTQLGSFVRVADPDGRLAPGGPFTLWAYIWARTPAKGRQGILTRWQSADGSGYALEINEDGALAFRVGAGGSTDCRSRPASRSSRASGTWSRPPTTPRAARPRSIRSRSRTATATTSPRSCRWSVPATRAGGSA